MIIAEAGPSLLESASFKVANFFIGATSTPFNLEYFDWTNFESPPTFRTTGCGDTFDSFDCSEVGKLEYNDSGDI
jgi:hypothetical protein